MVNLLEKMVDGLAEWYGVAAPVGGRSGGPVGSLVRPLREREHLVERGLVGDEPAVREGRACPLDLFRRKLQGAGDPRERVVAQPGGVTDQDEEEVEEQLRSLKAFEVPVTDETVVEPAEGPWDLAKPVGTEDSFGDHTGEGTGGGLRDPSSLVSRRRSRVAKRELKTEATTTFVQNESCISAPGGLAKMGSSLFKTGTWSRIESCISARAFRPRSWRSLRRALSRVAISGCFWRYSVR
jgi:hypothetical protein